MDRVRRTAANRRRPRGASTSPTPLAEDASFDQQSAASPVVAHATNTPQSAPQGRRATKSLHQAFTFSTPGPNRPLNLRKRSKTMDDYAMADDDFDHDSPKKGGHSLRNRARVDYTFEQIDDDVEVPSSTAASASRNKKRKSDNSYDTEDLFATGLRRREASVDADTPSSRRRNPARKSSEMRAYQEEIDEDENDVQDTIEVGVSFSDSEKSDMPHVDQPNTSSTEQSTEAPQNHTPTHSHQDSMHAGPPVDDLVKAASENDSGSPANEILTGESNAERPSQDTDSGNTLNVRKSSAEPQAEIQESENSAEAHVSSERASEPPHDTTQTEQPPQAQRHILSPVTARDEPSLTGPGDDYKEAGPSENGLAPSVQFLEQEIFRQEPETLPNSDPQSPAPLSPAPQSPAPQSLEPHPVPLDASHIITTASIQIDDIQGRAESSQEEDTKTLDLEPSATNDMVESPPSSVAPETTLPDTSRTTSAETSFIEPASVPGDEVGAPPTVQPLDRLPKPVGQTLPEPPQAAPSKPQPRPVGRWAHLAPYIDGEYVSYPERKSQPEDEAGASEYQTPEDKDAYRDANYMEPMADDNDDIPDATAVEASTPALNTPTRGSPVPDSTDPTAANSPTAGGEDADEVDVSESQEPPERRRYFRYRKLRTPEEYISAIENYEDMSTADLYELMEAINVSLVQWQDEWNGLGRIVDDYENSLRRRAADAKYESRTRNFHQHGINYEEPDFAVKGYKAKDKEVVNETRYLQSQDRIMAASYGFEYDPHPSKIGRQNPETQQVGIMTRGRSLRNQPKPTAKATEADEVTGKRQRKPVQLFDPATQDASRSSTPVPTRGRRRKNAYAENEDTQPTASSSFNCEPASDGEGGEASKMRRKRGPRPKTAVPNIVEELAPASVEESSVRDTPSRSGRRGRAKQPVKYDDDAYPFQFVEEEPRIESKEPRRSHILTLKIPKSKNLSEPSSAITDNGDSRPSTASSDSTSHTAESSYSFRPKRQKRFRDDPDDSEETSQSKKRIKRGSLFPAAGEETATPMEQNATEAPQNANRKIQKIKVVRTTPASRKGTPSSLPNGEEGDEPQKDYKSMTKSEKMSASMKSRWANGNMAGAVEKRKATLAAKKAAQAAAEQRVGLIAPKPKAKFTKKDPMEQGQPPAFSQTTLPGIGFPFPAA